MSGVKGGFVVALGLFFGIFVIDIFWDCGLDLLVGLLVVVFVDLDPDCFFVCFIVFSFGVVVEVFFLVKFCGFLGFGVVVVLDRVCCFLFKRVSFYCFVLWFL